MKEMLGLVEEEGESSAEKAECIAKNDLCLLPTSKNSMACIAPLLSGTTM